MEWGRVKLSARSTAKNQHTSYMAGMQTLTNAPSQVIGTQGKLGIISTAEHGEGVGIQRDPLTISCQLMSNRLLFLQ